MELKTRSSYGFIEIKVDEIETTIFKSSQSEIDEFIFNLLDVIDDVVQYSDKDISEYLNESGIHST